MTFATTWINDLIYMWNIEKNSRIANETKFLDSENWINITKERKRSGIEEVINIIMEG